jgi:light-regulated signal transduction histidine kinase (bacteriophytochrome)
LCEETLSLDISAAPLELISCGHEPIHIPGSIQPHGIMLVADIEHCRIRQVAGAVETQLGVAEWQDADLAVFIGENLSAKIRLLAASGAIGGFMGQFRTQEGETLDISAHVSAPDIMIELEPASSVRQPASFLLDELAGAATEFEQSTSLGALCDQAATQFRRLTGFDRVMVYQFLEDGVGCVVAEDKKEGMHTFLNHHFPASDIPSQARALYVRNLIRVIPDVSYTPGPLRSSEPVLAQVDMSDSSLRSVSPIHIEYLKNMGVQASASVSIVKDGVLWGLIACHHQTPRAIVYDIRAACRSLAGSLARHIKAKEEAEGYRQRIRLRGFEDDIVELLSREGPFDEILAAHLDETSRMMNSDGLAILREGKLITFGFTPDDREIRGFAEWCLARDSDSVFWTEKLSTLYSPAACFQQFGSGVLAVTLSAEEPWILMWFRAEQAETVEWAGNPHKAGSDSKDILTPRASFAAWREEVHGHSMRWSLAEIEAAARLRTAFLQVQQNRRVRELNRQLTKTLQDKDSLLQEKQFLIGEVNHRVQNSLQLVSSYLSLQARSSANTELQTALEEARRRLSAVALVHRRLYRSDQLGVVDMARYVEELCADTFSFKGVDWAEHLTLNLSPVLVSTDRAVTLGLAITELMINSNKHAYDGHEGPIEVELIQDRTHLQLIVADKGSGKIATEKGFGSRMVEGLVSQLGGELSYSDNRPGLRTTLRLPIQVVATL